jgi:DNA repair protein RecO (recombination protein O)
VSLYSDSAVVVRTYRLGEADRIVVLVSEHHGKVRAVAKGVRRTQSKFGARLEPLSHISFLAWKGKGDLDTINQAQVLDPFVAMRNNLERLQSGLSIVEIAEQIVQEGHPNPQIYAMVVGALRTAADPARRVDLVAPAFMMKALAADGAHPVLSQCASCGETADLVAFDLNEGGVLCRACRRGRPISESARGVLAAMVEGGLSALLSSEPPECADEVRSIATEAMEAHLERRLRAARSLGSW